MLIRKQVLITDWLNDYITYLAELYDVSYSEVVRLGLCFEFITTIKELYPKSECEINRKELLNLLQKTLQEKKTTEEAHRFISKLYFESRKAIEFRMKRDKMCKKK